MCQKSRRTLQNIETTSVIFARYEVFLLVWILSAIRTNRSNRLKKLIQTKKIRSEYFGFSAKSIFIPSNSYSRNPQAHLSSNMYVSFRLSSLLRPHCPPKDTQVTNFPEIRHTGVFTSCLSPTTVSIVRTYAIPYCDTRNNQEEKKKNTRQT